MNIEIQIIKDLPTEQINQFEDKTVYNCALFTRELTKSTRAFPYRTGELERNEIAEPITGSNKEYGLTRGVSYATYVWKMKNANWTNPNTQPQWYYSVLNKSGMSILTEAVNKSLKEI